MDTKKLIQSVPNFSEGRDMKTVEKINGIFSIFSQSTDLNVCICF